SRRRGHTRVCVGSVCRGVRPQFSRGSERCLVFSCDGPACGWIPLLLRCGHRESLPGRERCTLLALFNFGHTGVSRDLLVSATPSARTAAKNCSRALHDDVALWRTALSTRLQLLFFREASVGQLLSSDGQYPILR